MSCTAAPVTFRLLDGYVGWDAAGAGGLAGLDAEGGITLALAGPASDLPAAELARRFGDPRLARGCGPCEWYLAASPLLHRDGCDTRFTPLWPDVCGYELAEPVAVAARGAMVAVAERGRVRVWADRGARLIGDIRCRRPGPLAFTASGHLLVASGRRITRYTPSGDDLGSEDVAPGGTVTHLAVGSDCSWWAVVRARGGSARLYKGAPFRRASADEARAVLPEFPVAVSERGFCIDGRDCYDFSGEPLATLPEQERPAYVAEGELLTTALDSAIPRCRWHRVRVDADLPAGTGLEVSVATVEDPAQIPHADDWQRGGLDFLVDRPPGRHALVRLRLTGGAATPHVRRVRLDMPRTTSAALLPAIYHEPPEAADFTERFAALFDASIEEVDRVIERYPALLDIHGVPDEALAWLGSFLDVAAEPWWGAERYRRVLAAAPELYRRRGTPAGLAEAVQLLLDVPVAINESAAGRAWGAVGRTAHVGSTRLFGRARSRVRLGRSPLGATPVRSIGDPDLDPLTSTAQRFTVVLPASAVRDPERLASVRRLVAAQAPAHAVGGVRAGGDGFVVGSWSAVGIDTALTALPAPVVGETARLSRASVLRPGRLPRPPRVAQVGIDTVAR